MATLPQTVINEFSNEDVRIISCGVDPSDGGLYMITSSSETKVIFPNGHMIPVNAFPSHDGKLLGVSFKSYRGVFGIDCKLALKVAKNCLNHASLFVHDTYMCNLDIDAQEENET
jgi:hypothetical protein